MIATLEARGYPGFGAGIQVEHLTTPADWERLGMAAGTPFAAAHTLLQSGPFRPRNLLGDNIVFTGSGTHPGVGIPTVLISGPARRRTHHRPHPEEVMRPGDHPFSALPVARCPPSGADLLQGRL